MTCAECGDEICKAWVLSDSKQCWFPPFLSQGRPLLLVPVRY